MPGLQINYNKKAIFSAVDWYYAPAFNIVDEFSSMHNIRSIYGAGA